ncbi:MAG: transglycosylase family protein [Frankiaceae bacterium]|nr:transglycosylase family protein [Frankiaceae bacterium]
MAAAGLSASFVAADVAAFASNASAATADDFRRLRQCESGGNYAINTGNGFYGAYQFDRGTWNGLGYAGRADQAAPATQDAAAAKLQSQRGWSPWPACSRALGLGRSSAGAGVVANTAVAPTRVEAIRASRSRTAKAIRPAAPRVRVAVAPMTPPPFLHRQLSVADQDQFRIGVHMWQDRMAKRGWPITVDGYFGPQSAAIAKKFAAEKNIRVSTLPGEVDRGVWDAAWTLPVS